MSRLWLPAIALFLFILAGCGRSSAQVGLSGNVTLDGEPVARGRITFLPEEGTDSRAAVAVVQNGSYRIAADQGPKAGNYRAEISAQRKTGKKIPAGSPLPPGTMVDEEVEAVPERYNAKSTLRVTLEPGANIKNFELTSK